MKLASERQNIPPERCRHVLIKRLTTKAQQIKAISIPAAGDRIECEIRRPRAIAEQTLMRIHIGGEAIGMMADSQFNDEHLILGECGKYLAGKSADLFGTINGVLATTAIVNTCKIMEPRKHFNTVALWPRKFELCGEYEREPMNPCPVGWPMQCAAKAPERFKRRQDFAIGHKLISGPRQFNGATDRPQTSRSLAGQILLPTLQA